MEVINWLREYRELEATLAWNGTFADYLQMVTKKPKFINSIGKGIWSMVKYPRSRRTR